MPKPFEFPTPSSYQTPHEFANGLEKRSEDNEWIGTPGIYTNYLRGESGPHGQNLHSLGKLQDCVTAVIGSMNDITFATAEHGCAD